jgi:uncharacterized protein (TIGR04255 family)
MPEWERFPKAPIAEALLDVRAVLPDGTDLRGLARVHDLIQSRYPTRRERHSWRSSFRFDAAGAVEMSQTGGRADGYLFVSADQRQIVQARLDGFTFNRLRPYDSWSAFRDEAREHWEHYRAVAEPTAVSRIALRYINRIQIPLTATDFNDYVLTAPQIAPGLPQGLAHFLVRLVIPMERFECVAVVTETMEPVTGEATPFILDLDVVMERPMRPDGPEMWNAFEHLRECKNTIFFESVTPRAQELFR